LKIAKDIPSSGISLMIKLYI